MKKGLGDKIFFIIMGILMLLFFLLLALAMLEGFTQEYLGKNEVKCYDKRGNEIEGLVCYDEFYGCGIVQRNLGDCNYDLDIPISDGVRT